MPSNTLDRFRLTNRTALVTGARREIGRAIALALAKEAGIQTPLAEATLAQYRRMMKQGLGDLDKSGVAELTFRGRNN